LAAGGVAVSALRVLCIRSCRPFRSIPDNTGLLDHFAAGEQPDNALKGNRGQGLTANLRG
jgi:hypothetical protein